MKSLKNKQKSFFDKRNRDLPSTTFFRKSGAGFTIAELLVVISIMGLLGSIVLVSTKEARNKARLARGRQFSSTIYHALGAYGAAFYDLDSLAGDEIIDNSGNENHGDLKDTGGRVSVIPNGMVGSALEFDRDDPYTGKSFETDPGENSSLDFTEAITIEAWVKLSETAATYAIAYKKSVFCFFIKNGAVYFLIVLDDGSEDGISEEVCTDAIIRNNKWHHLAATYNGSKMKIFVDGKSVKLNGNTGDQGGKKLITNNGPLLISARLEAPGDHFDGVMDELRIYKEGF